MSFPISAVLVHNLGHREVFARLSGEEGLRRISNQGQHSFARDIRAALASNTDLRTDASGIDVLSAPYPLEWKRQRLKARLLDRREQGVDRESAQVEALYFPLVDVAIQAVLDEMAHEASTLHIVLVSSGPSSDGNDNSLETQGKSTEELSRLVGFHVRQRWPNVIVHHAHRSTDQPFTFANSADQLRTIDGIIASARRPVVTACGEDWVQRFRVFLSANTGTIATISAMLEGLRSHRPALVHIPTAYAWPEDASGQILPPRATVLSNDELTQRPPRNATELSDEAHLLAVREMRHWRSVFVQSRPKRAAEKDQDAEHVFWFRKGRKEVLALLVVRDPDTGKLSSHRGVNIEVSLPTGTLCAERNAIGTAFAAAPGLRRQDILAVAVLSLDDGLGPRLGPCGACTEWLRKVAEVNPDFRVITFEDLECESVFIDPVD